MARSGIFAVLEHEDRDTLCRAVKEVFDVLEKHGVKVSVQGWLPGDSCFTIIEKY